MNEMNQQPSEGMLLSKCRRPVWDETSSSSNLLCSFSVSSLLPSVDFESFNDVHFGRSWNDVENRPCKPTDIFDNYLPTELVEQSTPLQPRKHLLTERRGTSRLMSLKSEKVSFNEIYRSRNNRTIYNEMMRTRQVDLAGSSKPVTDIPLASTSGRASGEFWNERRRRKSFEYEPWGTLYNPQGGDGVRNYVELPCGKSLEDNARIDQNHSVSTGFHRGRQVDEGSIWLSTSHKLGMNHALATQYANDLKGGDNFNVNTTHRFVPDSTLSTNLYTNSNGECSLEVELQREKKQGNHEVLESIMANLRTGERLLKLQSRDAWKDVEFLNSVVSNLRGQHALRCMATIPLWRSGFVSNSVGTDLHGSQMICMNVVQKIHDQIMLGTSFTTNLKQEDSISLEAKHQLDGMGNLVVKLDHEFQALTKWGITTSLITKRNSWLWTYRNCPAEGRTSGLEWRHEVSPDKFFSIQAAAKDWTCTLMTEICLPC